ncbi:MAG: hypothetical protein HQM08_27335 [Candidatus Riflebacteria bacterium]|nr:hypothetical protein [Candidatus Riflebacteria bacterium]
MKTPPMSENLRCALSDAKQIKTLLRKAQILLRLGKINRVNENLNQAIVKAELFLIASADLRQ